MQEGGQAASHSVRRPSGKFQKVWLWPGSRFGHGFLPSCPLPCAAPAPTSQRGASICSRERGPRSLPRCPLGQALSHSQAPSQPSSWTTYRSYPGGRSWPHPLRAGHLQDEGEVPGTLSRVPSGEPEGSVMTSTRKAASGRAVKADSEPGSSELGGDRPRAACARAAEDSGGEGRSSGRHQGPRAHSGWRLLCPRAVHVPMFFQGSRPGSLCGGQDGGGRPRSRARPRGSRGGPGAEP